MAIRRATLDDLDQLVALEQRFFTGADERPDLPEAYRFILAHGEAYLADGQAAMLAILPVDALASHREEALALPPASPLRQRFDRGYLADYPGHQFIHAFLGGRYSPGLTAIFRDQELAVGFVGADHEHSLRFYARLGCEVAGQVQNLADPSKMDLVLTYKRPRQGGKEEDPLKLTSEEGPLP
ncbi:MAG: hypothetical protein HY520_02070 [Candidatus Aenigmarchaeota archaeon]|nr:hypothetical protein [Candidatus Aenigmarchaeota archaeon]